MANIRDADVKKRKTLNSQCINQVGIYENDKPWSLPAARWD
jgi:hypothetical protein